MTESLDKICEDVTLEKLTVPKIDVYWCNRKTDDCPYLVEGVTFRVCMKATEYMLENVQKE